MPSRQFEFLNSLNLKKVKSLGRAFDVREQDSNEQAPCRQDRKKASEYSGFLVILRDVNGRKYI
jgi:hypothetical protein